MKKASEKVIPDFPGGPVVKNLPANAGDTGSVPDPQSQSSHAREHLGLCATTTELEQEMPLQRETACHI